MDVVYRHRTKGLPSPITAEVLGRAGISDSLIPRTFQALQGLDLIDEQGNPTETFEGLRLAAEADYKLRLTEWLNAAYADVLKFVDPGSATETEVRDAFRSYTPVGQQPRMVTLFLGLYADAGVAPEKASAKRGQRKTKNGNNANTSAAPKRILATPGQHTTSQHETPPDKNQRVTDTFERDLLNKFPPFDPAWPDELKAKWFAGFEQFMGMVKK